MAVSQTVLLEAQSNIQATLGEEAIKRFQNFLAIVYFSLAALPDRTKLKRLGKWINQKDVHVVGAAFEIQASFLLALDKGLVLEVNKANLRIHALSPGDFIKTILPDNADYISSRN